MFIHIENQWLYSRKKNYLDGAIGSSLDGKIEKSVFFPSRIESRYFFTEILLIY